MALSMKGEGKCKLTEYGVLVGGVFSVLVGSYVGISDQERSKWCNQAIFFYCFFAITQNAITREPIAQSPLGFHQIKA